MPETNLELCRRMLAAFNARGLEGAVEFFDEDVEVYDPDLPSGTRIKGHDALLRTFGEMLDAFEVMKVEDFEVIPAGDRVVCLIHTAGQGRGLYGQVDFEQRDAHLMTFRDGKITYWRLYLDQAEALTDAGLDPAFAWHRQMPPEPAPLREHE
jgi:ketosteroid isomerase-like protein